MYSRQLEGVELPTRTAIGRDPQTGQFLTHEFKEYPEGFCRALAEAVLDMIKKRHREVQHSYYRFHFFACWNYCL